MNKSGIEWTDLTWNPITGCRHGCDHCYALGIANHRKKGLCVELMEGSGLFAAEVGATFPAGFRPTLYPHRFAEPEKVKAPSVIFTGSMADVFGDWVPFTWLAKLFAAMKRADRHTYIVLTKNPQYALSYIRSVGREKLPTNLIIGTSIEGRLDERERKRLVDLTALKTCGVGTVLSLEPYTQQLTCADWSDVLTATLVEWLIVGGRSAANGLPAFRPGRQWVDETVEMADEFGVPLFIKHNAEPFKGFADDGNEYHPIINRMRQEATYA